MSVIKAQSYQIQINEDWSVFTRFVNTGNYSMVFILVDENTKTHCYQKIKSQFAFDHQLIEIPSGEINKNLNTCQHVWQQLLELNCDRKSLMINLGGGVIGDLGGFCASTYMRGIDFIQVPTTLLSQVDASVGGKLGVDFQKIKNIVGVFNDPQLVWVNTSFLSSLPANELRSGYAEVIKHALILDINYWSEIKEIKDLASVSDWGKIVTRSIEIKNEVVIADPYEKNQRKTLNYGHTIGHAIESTLLNTEHQLLHGEAIAQGMVLEANLSLRKNTLSKSDYVEVKAYIEEIFGKPEYQNIDIQQLISNATKDKKNFAGEIRMAFIDQIGSCLYDIKISPEEIKMLFV